MAMPAPPQPITRAILPESGFSPAAESPITSSRLDMAA